MTAAAHVRQLASGDFVLHALDDHLLSVARLAGEFAGIFDAGSWAELAGIWHDLGKYQATFQKYIASASGLDRHIEAPGQGEARHCRGDSCGRSAGIPWSVARLSDCRSPCRFARLAPRGSGRGGAFPGAARRTLDACTSDRR
ncbi:MAG: CRISPR-associated endonuclease Cas3'' [Candidatus Accumulibacter meliphilus]|uniref:CRISPR-associated endonuclease Cas3'' n=1 Tax=Candidatus Accumulibacter meliphilus TaxID=2211374 RepID=UPI002FC30C32